MNRIKHFCAAITLMLPLVVSAQQYRTVTAFETGNFLTYMLGIQSATNLPATAGWVSATDDGNVAIALSCYASNVAPAWNGPGIETKAVTAVFAPAVVYGYPLTNANYDGFFKVVGTVNTNLANPRIFTGTNINLGAYGYLKLLYITNEMTKACVTNIVVTATTKPGV